ncbi:MAG: sulfatase [Rikenellaceae bacterium]
MKTNTIIATSLLIVGASDAISQNRPNVLLVISDDQGWPHAGAYGTEWVNTPVFDQLAEEGALFHNAFSSAPSSAPSRLSMLTGRHFYQNKEGGLHGGFIPKEFPLMTDILTESGYQVGYTGKGVGPFGKHDEYGIAHNPLGATYNSVKVKDIDIISTGNIDYAANFELFLGDNDGTQPFFFAFNCWEPHRGYAADSGERAGKDPNVIDMPNSLPDMSEFRSDLNDYGYEIDYYDKQLGRFIETLKERGLYENTLIIVTSDNGMPFSNSKMQCYETGTHVPFLVCWSGVVEGGQSVEELISLPEMSSFILQAAKVEVPETMMGSSIPNLVGLKGYDSAPANEFVVWGKEKHNPARENNFGYPIRAIRSDRYLLVHNYEPTRSPAGDAPYYKDLSWSDVDRSLNYEVANRDMKEIAPYFKMHTDLRPEYELFDIKRDPYCVENLAEVNKYRKVREELTTLLSQRLLMDCDPREMGDGEFFDSAPTTFANPMKSFANPKDKDGEPIFTKFPEKMEYIEGMRRFSHPE